MSMPFPALGIVLDARSPLPLYSQLYTAIRRRILDGRCPEGALLPSENAFADALGISRITVKRAFDELAARGLVLRQRGRGTQVLKAPAQRPVVAGVDGLVESSLVMGRDTTVELRAFDYVPADAETAADLGIENGAPVQWAVRVRRERGVPFSQVTTWLPEGLGRSFTRAELMVTPLVLLLERAGVQFSSAEQVIGAETASPEVAQALGVAAGAALLRIHRISRDQHDRPAELTKVLYNPHVYQYKMRFAPESGK